MHLYRFSGDKIQLFSSPKTTATTFLLFSLHHHHISIVSPPPPPPPPHFYCFLSTTTTTTATTFLLFSSTTTTATTFTVVFPPRDSIKDYQLPFLVSFCSNVSCSEPQSWFSSAVSCLPCLSAPVSFKDSYTTATTCTSPSLIQCTHGTHSYLRRK